MKTKGKRYSEHYLSKKSVVISGDRGDYFKVVGLKKPGQYQQTLRSVFCHLSYICVPSGALENKSQQLKFWGYSPTSPSPSAVPEKSYASELIFKNIPKQ